MRRRRNLEGLRRALDYRETLVDDDGEWDLGVEVRAEAAEALGDFEPRAVADDMAKALADPQPAVRLAAINTIATFDAPIAVESLAGCAVAREDGSEEGSARALEILEVLELEGSAERVVEKLLAPGAAPLDEAHREAVESLVDKDPRGAEQARAEVADLIVAVLQDPPDDDTPERAERILGWLGRSVVDVVLDALNDGKGSPALLQAAGRLGDARAIDPIVAGLESDDPEMRRSAAVAAGNLNHTRAVIGLLGATQDSEQRVRNAATVALNQMGTAAVIAAMATFMQLGMEDQMLARGQLIPDTEFLPAGDPQPVGGGWVPPAGGPQEDATASTQAGARRRTGGLVERLFGRIQ